MPIKNAVFTPAQLPTQVAGSTGITLAPTLTLKPAPVSGTPSGAAAVQPQKAASFMKNKTLWIVIGVAAAILIYWKFFRK